MKAGERGPQSLRGALVIRATLTCAWCAREVTGAKAQREVGSGRILLAPAPTSFRLAGGRPLCIACGGPLLLEDWRSEAATLDLSSVERALEVGGSRPEQDSDAA